jgi:hypothetical protein
MFRKLQIQLRYCPANNGDSKWAWRVLNRKTGTEVASGFASHHASATYHAKNARSMYKNLQKAGKSIEWKKLSLFDELFEEI